MSGVPYPNVSRLWITVAERVIDRAEIVLSEEESTAIRVRLRAAAVEIEALLNVIADGGRAERVRTVAVLVERFDTSAHDVDEIAAAVISEAVTIACSDVGVAPQTACRLADACSASVLDAGRSLDAVARSFPRASSIGG